MHLLIDQPGQSKLKNVEVKPQLTRLKRGWVYKKSNLDSFAMSRWLINIENSKNIHKLYHIIIIIIYFYLPTESFFMPPKSRW